MCSATSQKYVSRLQQTTLSLQNIIYAGVNGFTRNNYNMAPSTKQSPISSIQIIVLIVSVLLCVFSCLLTVTLSYKWHMDTTQQTNRLVGTVEDVVRDLNTFTDIVRDELVAKRVSNAYKDQHKAEIDGNDDEESYGDFKETLENAAAHFTSDSSKYSTKKHPHYNGNGHLRHQDGDFRDWTQHIWDINLTNANDFIMKNGKVEVLNPGLYFVYAQMYYSDKHDINGYYVMKNDEKILGCTSTRHEDTQSSYSCYTGGLIYFSSKDNLSIRGLDGDRFIILDPVRSFFGLLRILKGGKK